jgi:hypothetical protein
MKMTENMFLNVFKKKDMAYFGESRGTMAWPRYNPIQLA